MEATLFHCEDHNNSKSSSATTIVRPFACVTRTRLLQCILQVIGPLYFTHGPAVLEAVFSSFEDWPAPCPGSLCPLPFLGETVMFQVPDIDMPPQVASNYRYHRGVHLCASWSRSRVVSLTRTLSGCGSISASFSVPGSPGSRRRGVGPSPLEDPEGGGGEQQQEEEQQHPGSRRGSSGGVGADSVGAGAPTDGGGGIKDTPTLSGGGPPRSSDRASADGAGVCLQGGGGRRPSTSAALGDDGASASPSHRKNTCGTPTGESNGQESWGAVQARRTPSPGAGGGGGVFWNGPCGSPGGLTSPDFRLPAGEAFGEGGPPPGMRAGGQGRSSFGATSLASVICESPSEVRVLCVAFFQGLARGRCSLCAVLRGCEVIVELLVRLLVQRRTKLCGSRFLRSLTFWSSFTFGAVGDDTLVLLWFIRPLAL